MPHTDEDADSRRAQRANDTKPQAQDERAPDRSGGQPQEGSGNQAQRTQRVADERPAGERSGSGLGAVFAGAALRWGIGIAGFVLFLFALGQAVGLDLLGLFAEALSSQTGRWLAVAVFGLFLVGVARRGVARAFRA
ncbi:hypothetical protein NDI76_12885 [Halogeometricum sp. S1BR25-6]|uniref:Uncharacterized protein n=1 Tax=Halogeometricum salsisoli TaxID=2950536 RepID=A0ABU2GH96_9EURY|nr:hypothetical protein [Halogeometricum sp. S1BR25-6]MDS0299638.1 hypothetical protein [Halogeometricum sp. S1BR25-6]